MTEIKSTLDLVMEKTKHLSLTPEEKKAQKLDEGRKKVKGLIQRYRDNKLNKEQFEQALEKLKDDIGLELKPLLVEQLVEGIGLNRPNEPQRTLLHEICGIETAAIDAVIGDYLEAIQAMSRARIEALKHNLAQQRSVSGSAVIPNFETDPLWQRQVSEIQHRFEQMLAREKAALQPDF